MYKKSDISEDEKKRLVDYVTNMTWEDIVEKTTIHFWELDKTKFKHREKGEDK
jgi:hypothetical protein